MNDHIADKNMKRRDDDAQAYASLAHSENTIRRLLDSPASAFQPVVLKLLPELYGRSVCVPSSGGNLAVFFCHARR